MDYGLWPPSILTFAQEGVYAIRSPSPVMLLGTVSRKSHETFSHVVSTFRQHLKTELFC